MAPDRTHDISNTPYHVRDIKALGEVLNNAAEAAFPNRGISRYKEVHTLLLSWEDDNLGVVDEVDELGDVFRHLYVFDTEKWKIPTKRSHNSLAAKILDFLDDYESKDNLLIVYYGGHGEMNDDRQCVWSCTESPDASAVQWYGIQTMLEQAKSDVLILLDCCAAASSATGSGSGITEIIAACGFEAWAPGVGQHSFTRSLIDELRYLHRTGPFSTSLLHNKVLSRVKYWKPRFAPSASHRELRRTPIYIVISDETRPRSIEIEAQQQPSIITVSSPSLESSLSSLSLSEDVAQTTATTSESSSSSANDVWPDKEFKCPKVLISVALEEEQWLSAQQWADWMRSIPGLVKYANVEGVYKSDSTLMLLTIPVAIWDLVPPNPAINFIGFTRSQDLMKQHRTPVDTVSQGHGIHHKLRRLHDRSSGSASFEELSKMPNDPIFADQSRLAPSLVPPSPMKTSATIITSETELEAHDYKRGTNDISRQATVTAAQDANSSQNPYPFKAGDNVWLSRGGFKKAATVRAVGEEAIELQYVIECDNEDEWSLASGKDLSIRYTFGPRSRTPPTTRLNALSDDTLNAGSQWYCVYCHWGPLSKENDAVCIKCGQWKASSAYSPRPPPQKGSDIGQKSLR